MMMVQFLHNFLAVSSFFHSFLCNSTPYIYFISFPFFFSHFCCIKFQIKCKFLQALVCVSNSISFHCTVFSIPFPFIFFFFLISYLFSSSHAFEYVIISCVLFRMITFACNVMSCQVIWLCCCICDSMSMSMCA